MSNGNRVTSREQLLLHRGMWALRVDMLDGLRRLLRHVRHLRHDTLQILVSVLTKEAWWMKRWIALMSRRGEWETWRRLLSDRRRRLMVLIVWSTRLRRRARHLIQRSHRW